MLTSVRLSLTEMVLPSLMVIEPSSLEAVITLPSLTSNVKSVTVVYPFGAKTSDKIYLPSGTFLSVALSFSFVSHEI